LAQSPAFAKALRDLKIDVVINENVLSGLVGFALARSEVLKVFDFSDYFPESASVYYSGSSAAKKMVEAVTLAITKLNVKLSNVCIAVCQSLINASKNIDQAKACYLITNGVNTCNRTEKPPAQNGAAPSIVVMGVIDDWLDLSTPLQALKALIRSYPDIKLIIIGPWQKSGFKAQFEAQAEALGLEGHVKITGYVSSSELERYISEAGCCLMPYKLDSFYSVIRLPEKLFYYSAHGKTHIFHILFRSQSPQP
jgi:glycosyltransferase involved in cell wall biosynthesis